MSTTMKKNPTKRIKPWSRRSLALLLVLSMTVSLLSGCSFAPKDSKAGQENGGGKAQSVQTKTDTAKHTAEETASSNQALNGYADTIHTLAETASVLLQQAEAGQTGQALRTAGKLRQAVADSGQAAGILGGQVQEVRGKLAGQAVQAVQERQAQFEREQERFREKISHTLEKLQQASSKKQMRKHARTLESYFRQEAQEYGGSLPPEQAEPGKISVRELPEQEKTPSPGEGTEATETASGEKAQAGTGKESAGQEEAQAGIEKASAGQERAQAGAGKESAGQGEAQAGAGKESAGQGEAQAGAGKEGTGQEEAQAGAEKESAGQEEAQAGAEKESAGQEEAQAGTGKSQAGSPSGSTQQADARYLECSGAAALTPAIRKKAEELQTPLAVYEYLRNRLDYEYYGGSRKGAGQTFAAMAGNDWDQASLLAAMLRYLGYETRYVRGKIRLDAGLAVRMTGAETPKLAAKVFAGSGNSVTLLTQEGREKYLEMEHVWAEAYLPYSDYRGAGRAGGKSMWVALDTGIKEYEDQETVYDHIGQNDAGRQMDALMKDRQYDDFPVFADMVVEQEQENFASELEKLGSAQDSGEFSYHLKKRGIRQENAGYLPNSLPYMVEERQEPSASPAGNDRDKVTFTLAGHEMLSWYQDENAGKRISLEFAPAAQEDAQILEEYGGLFQTPSYLVKLAPVFRLDGKTVKSGADISGDLAFSPGQSLLFELTIRSGGTQETVRNELAAGSMYAILLDGQNIPSSELEQAYDDYCAQADTVNTDNILSDHYLGRMLHLAGQLYFAQVDANDSMASQIMGVTNTRVLSEGITGYRVAPVTAGDSIAAVQEGSLYIDVDYNAHTPVSLSGSRKDEKRYLLTSGILASRMESFVWEQIMGDDAVSTIRILSEAEETGKPVLQLTSRNFEQETKGLSWDDSLKQDLREAVAAGNLVIIPGADTRMGAWQGTGYMVVDPESYAGAYIIHGGLAGTASGGAGTVRASLAYLVRGFSDALALISVVDAIVAVCDLLAVSATAISAAAVGGVLLLGILTVAGVCILGDCFKATEKYVEYMETGDEELRKQLEKEAAWAVAMDAVCFAAGKALKYLAKKFKLKVWEKWLAEDGICSGFTVTEMKNLKNAVIQEGQRLKDIGYTTDQLGPAIAGAYDQTTGKIYIAINDISGKPPKNLQPFLSERIDFMPKCVEDSYLPYTKGMGSHAEIYAVNELLRDHPSVEISKIMVYVNRTLGTSKPVTELPFETCPHCRYILMGLTIISNVQ